MRYVVTGRVHPERADISFSRVEWRPSENGVAFASCESSQITVVLDDPSIDGWISAYVTADILPELWWALSDSRSVVGIPLR